MSHSRRVERIERVRAQTGYGDSDPGGAKGWTRALPPQMLTETGRGSDSPLFGGVIWTDATVEHPKPPAGTSLKVTRNSAEPFGESVTGEAVAPESWVVICSGAPAPAPPAPDAPKNAILGYPSSEHAEGPSLVTVKVAYELPAAEPPRVLDGRSTPVEHEAASAVEEVVEDTGVVVVGAVLGTEVEVVVELGGCEQAVNATPAMRTVTAVTR